MTLEKNIIAARIADIYREISEYDNANFFYDVAIYNDGTVMRGDLHIDDSTYTRWDDSAVIATLRLRPAFTASDITDNGEDPGDEETVKAWREEADWRIRQYAEEIAAAVVGGKPIDNIAIAMWG
jgi:hypothetical protein